MAADAQVKKTKELFVFENPLQAENVLKINPNDGLELGIMKISRRIRMFAVMEESPDRSFTKLCEDGEIYIDNNCRNGTIEISAKLRKKIGKIEKIVLLLKESSIYIVSR